MKSKLFRRAWAIAREAQARFGGSCRDFFSEALRMAWSEEVEMVEEVISFVRGKLGRMEVRWAGWNTSCGFSPQFELENEEGKFPFLLSNFVHIAEKNVWGVRISRRNKMIRSLDLPQDVFLIIPEEIAKKIIAVGEKKEAERKENTNKLAERIASGEVKVRGLMVGWSNKEYVYSPVEDCKKRGIDGEKVISLAEDILKARMGVENVIESIVEETTTKKDIPFLCEVLKRDQYGWTEEFIFMLSNYFLAEKERFEKIQAKEDAIQKKENAHANKKAELEEKYNAIVWVLPDAGWRLVEKNIAPSDWAKINPIYYSSQDLDEMDYFTNSPGWRIDKESIAKLISLGYTIINCNTLEIVS